MFHHFGWKLPIQGQTCRVLGVNRVIFQFFILWPQKGTSLRDSAPFEPLRVKIRPGVSSLRWSEENKINKKSHKKLYFTPLPEVPRERIFTKFRTNVPLVDLINPDKLCVNLFEGFDFKGVKVSIFSIGNWSRRYNAPFCTLQFDQTRKVSSDIQLLKAPPLTPFRILCINYYHAMLCVSVVFAVAGLSGCLSVTFFANFP